MRDCWQDGSRMQLGLTIPCTQLQCSTCFVNYSWFDPRQGHEGGRDEARGCHEILRATIESKGFTWARAHVFKDQCVPMLPFSSID